MEREKEEVSMQAAIFRGAFDIQVEQIPDAAILEPTDAVVQITHACICGTDLWSYRGQQPYQPGWQIGHEWMGILERKNSLFRTRYFSVSLCVRLRTRVGSMSCAPFTSSYTP